MATLIINSTIFLKSPEIKQKYTSIKILKNKNNFGENKVSLGSGTNRPFAVLATANLSIPENQKGWQYATYGPPSVLEFSDIAVPHVGDDQVNRS